jgi:hypothetical protein
MARLLVDGERYDGLASAALLEHEYEAIVLDRSHAVFPDFTVVPFKKTVRYEGEPRKADLALIDPGYRSWWVCEVEMAHHSFENHVLPQVVVLAHASYGVADAAWLAQREGNLDRAALEDMMRGAQPGVVVVVNAPMPEWVEPLRQHNALLMVLEVFRSSRNRLILRQNGVEPTNIGDLVSRCRIDPAMPRMLILESPVALPADEDPFHIEFAGGSSEWRVIRAADRAWLSPVRGSPFPTAVPFLDLVKTTEGRLAFRVAASTQKGNR